MCIIMVANKDSYNSFTPPYSFVDDRQYQLNLLTGPIAQCFGILRDNSTSKALFSSSLVVI